MSWTAAMTRGLLVFVYFALATVWLPDRILRLSVIAEASDFLRDLVVLVVWGTALGAGMLLLRRAQRRSII